MCDHAQYLNLLEVPVYPFAMGVEQLRGHSLPVGVREGALLQRLQLYTWACQDAGQLIVSSEKGKLFAFPSLPTRESQLAVTFSSAIFMRSGETFRCAFVPMPNSISSRLRIRARIASDDALGFESGVAGRMYCFGFTATLYQPHPHFLRRPTSSSAYTRE